MTSTPNLPNPFTEFEYQGWQQSASQYHALFGSLTKQTINALLDAVQAKPGDKILDVATGPGYVAARAQERQCQVIGLDFSEAMLAKAREVNPSIEFVRGSAEELPFNDGEFDAVVMNFGILHLAEPQRAIKEAFRVTRQGGSYGFTVWKNLEQSIGIRLIHEAIQTHGDFSVSLPEGPPFFYYSNPNNCIEALSKAGFVNATTEELYLSWQLANADELFAAFAEGTGRTGGFLRSQTEECLEKIREAVRQSAAKYIQNNHLVLPMAALVAAGEKL